MEPDRERLMRERRYTLRLDEDTLIALRRIADAEERTMAAQIRLMVRTEAAKRGLWTPRRPTAVPKAL